MQRKFYPPRYKYHVTRNRKGKSSSFRTALKLFANSGTYPNLFIYIYIYIQGPPKNVYTL